MRSGNEFFETLGQPLGDAVIDRPFDQDAAAGRAGLAAILDDGVDEHWQRLFDVGIGKDDLRRFAAKLHGDAAIVDCGRLLDRSAGRRRTGEGHVVDAGVRRQRGTGFAAIASDHVEHARRKAGLQRKLGHADAS